MEGGKAYSDLEPAPAKENDWSEKMTVPTENGSEAKEKENSTYLSPFLDSTQSITTPAPAYILVDPKGKQQPQVIMSDAASIRSSKTLSGLPVEFGMPKPEKRIFGIRRRNLVSITAGLAIFVVGLLVTTLAITLHQHPPPPTPPPSTLSTPSIPSIPSTPSISSIPSVPSPAPNQLSAKILGNSKVAAMNWTDATSAVSHSAVFYQDESNSLMLNLKNNVSNKWTTMNLTDNVLKGNQSLSQLDVSPGTALACATNKGLWNLYFHNSRNEVTELYSNDPYTLWNLGEFSTILRPNATPGSSLSAVWQTCQNCSQSLLLVYQEAKAGHLQLANFTGNVWASGPTVSKSASFGTGMAISEFTDFRGKSTFGTDTNALRVYYADSNNLFEQLMGPETKFQWGLGNSGNPINNTVPVNPSPEIASITFGSNGWDNNLVTSLANNGTLMAHVWRGIVWAVQSPVLAGSPSGVGTFSSIATTQDLKMYAICGGDIHEYSTSEADPFTWTWVEKLTIGET